MIPVPVAQKMPWSELFDIDDQQRLVTYKASTWTLEERDSKMASFLQDVRQKGVFKVLDGWRNELYPVYGEGKKIILNMERSATPLFGVFTYGVHMTAYVRTESGIKIWAPKRSPTKQTYPNMMDNTAAGGLTTGEEPMHCMIREANEEASLPVGYVQQNAICAGTVTYSHVRDGRAGGETGLFQPECQYVYDLELPIGMIPKPNDNEAVDFKLLSIEETKDAMKAGKFKPNCALILVDFFVRHGIITPENEPDYIELCSKMRRKFAYPSR